MYLIHTIHSVTPSLGTGSVPGYGIPMARYRYRAGTEARARRNTVYSSTCRSPEHYRHTVQPRVTVNLWLCKWLLRLLYEVLEIMTSVGRGNMVRTGEVKPVRHSELREAVTWDGAPSGIAEASFPHPHGWTIMGAPAGTTLERTSVRALTAIYRLQIDERPSCEKAWNKVFGTELDWKAIWRRFSNPLLTPRDYKNYYRFLHRSMRTRDLFPREGDEGNACRMCRAEGERFSHIPQCYSVLQIFERFTSFARSLVPTLQTSQELICFGTHGGQPLPGGLSAFHVIIW